MKFIKESVVNYFTLFGSLSTLICCALPALFVSLGMGAVVAGMASSFPALIWLSEHKIKIFSFAALMLLVNGYLIWRNRNAPCPIDPKLRDVCIKGRKYSRNLYFLSLGVFVTGFLFAYVVPSLMM